MVLVLVDTLRADHLGAYGYSRETSPFIDRLAREGLVFVDAVAPSSFTRESVAALWTARWPSCSGALGWEAAPRAAAQTLAEWLREQGYFTAMLTLTTMLGDPSFARGFDAVEHLTQQWGINRAGPQLSRRAVEVLLEHRERPVFLYVHFLDPHGPYDPPPEVLARFPATGATSVLDVYRDVRPRLPELLREGFGPSDLRFLELVRRYDAEIAHTDQTVQQLWSGIHAASGERGSLWILTSDHGEEFLEHGFVEHGWAVYQESTRIPLVLWWPGRLRSGRSSVPASLVDVWPTLAQLLDRPLPLAELDGRSLVKRVGSKFTASGQRERVRWSELLLSERNVVRAAWDGPWKYVVWYQWLAPEERSARVRSQEAGRAPSALGTAWPMLRVREELFALDRDAGEQQNLADAEPTRRQRFRRLLSEHGERCAPQSGQSSTTPRATLALGDQERMRQLGY